MLYWPKGDEKMDIRLLRYFLAVAREENITRAAKHLHMAQPSLSKQMMELEAELGRQLLIRGKRRITLTQDGILLRKRAEEIVALMDKTEQELRGSRETLSGRISIGGTPGKRILETAAALRNANPEVVFEFYSSDATDVTERLDQGSLDFAVLLEPVDTLKYEYVSLGEAAHWGLLLPEDSPLAAKPAVERSDLSAVPLILHRRAGLQREIAHWAQVDLEQLNITATYNVPNGDASTFVRSGLGYFLTSDNHLPQQLDPGLCFRPLSPVIEFRHALVWKRYAVLSAAADAFLQRIRE